MNIYFENKTRIFFLIVFLLAGLSAFQLQAIEVSVDSVNSSTVGLYEKFEIYAELDAVYSNPYNPEEIDVRAVFTSPTAEEWIINGFFDNYLNASRWKVRFSPNETGTWTYRLIATDTSGTDSSDVGTFEAVSSEYHGWIRVSPDNPRYLMYDDGKSFYGVGVYYPWGVNNSGSGLGKFTTYEMNIFGYWNSTYDGGGNGGGYYQIEDFRTGIGIYNQNKCARIDELLTWSEGRDIKMMFAIFPHDILSATVWATDWNHNAYNTICDADDFYGDSLSWEYQKKQFRYIIARWGHSRALGIWEIVNEINGTDGWGYVADAEAWFGSVRKYFVESDPYGRPTTGSKSGGIWDYWWAGGLQYMDLANIHLYERQGWTLHYPGDSIRSGLWNCVSSVRRLRNDYNKPAIFGEIGAEHAYATFGTYAYTIEYHNTLWGSLANGLAMSPVWWSYPNHVNDAMLYQSRCFSRFVSGVDFAHRSLDSTGIAVEDCDAYAIGNDTFALGWARETSGDYIGYKSLTLSGLQDREYVVKWFDCWEGEVIDEDTLDCTGGVLSATIPYIDDSCDIAFKVLTFFESSGVSEETEYSGEFKLLGNYPNPFTNSTAISYILPGQLKVNVKIYDVSGRLVASPVAGETQGPGKQTLQWDAEDMVPGIYFYRIEAGDGEYVKSGKCVLLR